MTQFASTLYPQTNPSNPILLSVRSQVDWANITDHGKREEVAEWLWWLTNEGHNVFLWQRRDHIEHAVRVLTRLAALSG